MNRTIEDAMVRRFYGFVFRFESWVRGSAFGTRTPNPEPGTGNRT